MHPSFKIESLLAARLFLSPQLVGRPPLLPQQPVGPAEPVRHGSDRERARAAAAARRRADDAGAAGRRAVLRLPEAGQGAGDDRPERRRELPAPFRPAGRRHPGSLLFGDRFAGQQLVCSHCDPERNIAIFSVDPRTDPVQHSFLVDLATLAIDGPGQQPLRQLLRGRERRLLADRPGATATPRAITCHLPLGRRRRGERKLLFGVPIEQRAEGQTVPLNSIACMPSSRRAAGCSSSRRCSMTATAWATSRWPTRRPSARWRSPARSTPARASWSIWSTSTGDRYLVRYNIDGCSWAYEGTFDEAALRMTLDRVICGAGRAERTACAQSIRYDDGQRRLRPCLLHGHLAGADLHRRRDLRGFRQTRRSEVDPAHARAAAGHRAGACSRPARTRPTPATTGCASRPALPARGRAGLRGAAAGRLLHPRRPAEPGAARLHLVLHAADPVLHAERLRRLRAQRARQPRLRPGLHEAGGSRLGRAGPAGPRGRVRDPEGAIPGST